MLREISSQRGRQAFVLHASMAGGPESVGLGGTAAIYVVVVAGCFTLSAPYSSGFAVVLAALVGLEIRLVLPTHAHLACMLCARTHVCMHGQDRGGQSVSTKTYATVRSLQ